MEAVTFLWGLGVARVAWASSPDGEHELPGAPVIDEDVELAAERPRPHGRNFTLDPFAGAGGDLEQVVALRTEAAVLPSARLQAEDADGAARRIADPEDDGFLLPRAAHLHLGLRLFNGDARLPFA